MTTTEPTDRLTRICDAMITTFAEHPEHLDGDRAIVFLDDREMGGIVLHGYDDVTEALTDMLMHLKAMARASGKDLQIVFLDADGMDRL